LHKLSVKRWYTKVYLFYNLVVDIFIMFMKTNKLEILTPREVEVLSLLVQGLLYKEIAEKLGVGLDTIKKHCKNIYVKLDVRNRTEAAIAGSKIGIK
jgi:DNA-binding NarL/FixJ family response regulator